MDCTSLYTCINEGCPDAGSTKMECKEGYRGGKGKGGAPDSPLCAVCEDNYAKRMSKCVVCEEPQLGLLALFLAVTTAVVAIAIRMCYNHRRFFASTGAFANFKILVSFVTIASTVSSQFGVRWPSNFQRALDMMSVVTFDIGEEEPLYPSVVPIR